MAQLEPVYFTCRYCRRELEGQTFFDQERENLWQSFDCATCNVVWQVRSENGKQKVRVLVQ